MISSQIERFEGSEVADLDGQVRDLVAGSILKNLINRFNTIQLHLGTLQQLLFRYFSSHNLLLTFIISRLVVTFTASMAKKLTSNSLILRLKFFNGMTNLKLTDKQKKQLTVSNSTSVQQVK